MIVAFFNFNKAYPRVVVLSNNLEFMELIELSPL